MLPPWLLEHWLPLILLMPACYGAGAWAGEARRRLWSGRPESKPRPYRVTIETDDGWPLRSYTLPPEAAGRLARDLDRDRDRDRST